MQSSLGKTKKTLIIRLLEEKRLPELAVIYTCLYYIFFAQPFKRLIPSIPPLIIYTEL